MQTLFVHEDPDLFAGFPIALTGSVESSPLFFDLDEDGDDELLVANSDGIMHAFVAEGGELDGWPVELGARKGHRDDQPNDHADACAYRPADDRGDCPTQGHVDYLCAMDRLGGPAAANLEATRAAP
jgi:hypothetical protein